MGKGKGNIPIRTCISCGVKEKKSELVRLVLDANSQAVVDKKAILPGRGAYIHDRRSCKKGLKNDKALMRSFRGKKVRSISPGLVIN